MRCIPLSCSASLRRVRESRRRICAELNEPFNEEPAAPTDASDAPLSTSVKRGTRRANSLALSKAVRLRSGLSA